MNKQEATQPNWDEVVAPIIKIKLDEAHEGQIKDAEFSQKMEEEREQKLASAQSYQALKEKLITDRWDLLNRLQAKELLEGLNNSQNIWKGLGTVKKEQFTKYDITSVEYSLEAPYATSVGGWAPNGGEGTLSWQFFPTVRTTSTKIGVTPAKILGIEDWNGQGLKIQNVDVFFKGPVFFEGDVLYIIDSHVGLGPGAEDDTFSEGKTSLIFPQYFELGIFLVDADHPRSREVLTEVLKRSCIRRAMADTLPYQLIESGNKIRQAEPVQKQKGIRARGFPWCF